MSEAFGSLSTVLSSYIRYSCYSCLRTFLYGDFLKVKTNQTYILTTFQSLEYNVYFTKCSPALGLISGCGITNWNKIT